MRLGVPTEGERMVMVCGPVPAEGGPLADALGLADPVRGLFVAAARGRVMAEEVLAARAGAAGAAGRCGSVYQPGD